VSAQTSVLDAPTWGTTKWAVIGMTAISMISLSLALVIARVISQPIVDLEKQASALLAGKAARLHSELSEIDHAWATLKEAVAERRRAEEQQRFLQNELAHRSKNLLAIVQTLVRLMGRSTTTPQQFSDELQSRLHGLALAQDLLTKSQSKGADLSALARQQLSMFLPKDDEGRVRLAGPAVFLPASNVTSVSMVLHELATNASKYGALSTPAGKIQMSWSLFGEGSVLRLTWKESGGPRRGASRPQGVWIDIAREDNSKLRAAVFAHRFPMRY
jgi:two-component sensor histidine kinase